jgi:hypothetical protein
MDWQVSCKWKEICKNEVSCSILTPIYLCSILAGWVVAPRVIVVVNGDQPRVTRVREPRVVDSPSTIKTYIYCIIVNNFLVYKNVLRI